MVGSKYEFYNKLLDGVTLLRVTLGVTWNQLIYIPYIYILKIPPLNYMFYMFLTFMPIFMSIGYYLSFDP